MKVLLAVFILSIAAFAQAPVPVRSIFSVATGRFPAARRQCSRLGQEVTNGASFQPGIASGSWVTVKGIKSREHQPRPHLASG